MIYYSYETFKNDALELAAMVKEFDCDCVIGIARGGLSIAQALAYALDVRNVQSVVSVGYEYNKKLDGPKIIDTTNLEGIERVLVVDDISDTGETFKEIMQRLQTNHTHATFKSAALFSKTSSCYQPDYVLRHNTEWINFFWEVDFMPHS